MIERTQLSHARRATGFTMIELLVVIAVLALLISLITTVASRVLGQQKQRNTQQIMANVCLAIDQFATENPLRAVYDRKDRATFGKYPPYQLANFSLNNSVATTVESNNPGGNNRLSDRLWRDLGNDQGNVEDWVQLGGTSQANEGDGNDDIRALHAYLKAYSPESVNLIPEYALKPVDPRNRDYINPQGTAGVPGTATAPDWVDVFGIHDAWGVPLDYMLYVKCEWGIVHDPATGAESNAYRVVERRYAVRSLGIDREVYDAIVAGQSDPTLREFDLSKWIFSSELPQPWFGGTPSQLADDGSYGFSGAANNGWVRVKGLAESYAYRPDGDAEQP